MSLLKAIKAQLGLSNTPANNFTLTAEADNGTLKLARGNAGATTQDILTVDAAGKVAFPQNVQTWQDVTASRAFGTLYTNTTVNTIFVSVYWNHSSAIQSTSTVGGNPADYSTNVTADGYGTVRFAVPPGATYSVTSAGTKQVWLELR